MIASGLFFAFKMTIDHQINLLLNSLFTGFCVERHDTIKTFQPEPFWVIQITAQVTEHRKLNLEWMRMRLFDRDLALAFYKKVKDSKNAR